MPLFVPFCGGAVRGTGTRGGAGGGGGIAGRERPERDAEVNSACL